MTCTEFLAKLTDYFDGETAAELEAQVRAHVAECDHCEVVLNTTRHTIEIYRDNHIYELPTEARECMIAKIMAKCKGKGC